MENENNNQSVNIKQPIATETPVVDGPILPLDVGQPVVASPEISNQEEIVAPTQPVAESIIQPVVAPEALNSPTEVATPEVNPAPVEPAVTPIVNNVSVVQAPVAESMPTLETVQPVGPMAEPAVVISPVVDNVQTPTLEVEPVMPPVGDVQTPVAEVPVAPVRSVTLDPSLNVQPIAPAVEEPKKPKKKGKALLIVLLLVIVAVVAAVFLKFFYFKPENNYNRVFTVYQKKVEKLLKQTVSPIESTFLESGSVTVDSNIAELSNLKNLKVDYTLGIDLANNKLEASAGLTEDQKEIINAAVYLLNNKLYLSSSKLYSKVLMLADIEEQIDFSELMTIVKVDDIIYLINSNNKYLIESLKNADYSSKYIKLNINGDNELVTDNTMIVNKNNIGKIIDSYVKSVKADKRLIKIMANLMQMEESEVTSALDEINNEELYSSFDAVVKIDLYTKLFGTKVAGLKVTVDNNTVFDMVCNSKNVIVKAAGGFDFTAISEDGKKFALSLKYESQELFVGSLTINNDNTYTIETTIQEYNIKVTVGYTLKGNTIDKTLIVEVNYNSEYLKLTYNGKTEYNVDIANLDVSNAVDINTLSNKELTTIYDNFEKALKNSSLYDMLSDVLSSYGISTSESRKNALVTEGIALVNASKTAYQAEQLTNSSKIKNNSSVCFNIRWLCKKNYFEFGCGDDNYSGSVLVAYNNGTYTYKYWISNGMYTLNNINFNNFDVDNSKVIEAVSASNNCGSSTLNGLIKCTMNGDKAVCS